MTSTDQAIRGSKIPRLSVLRAVWKRKLLIGLAWLLATGVAIAIVHSLPAIYRAETLILVEQQRIPNEFVKATVETDLQDRLSTLSQQILSYNRLLEIIKKFDLYKDERRSRTEEEIIEVMRKDIVTTLEKGWSRDRPGAFRIAYQGRDRNTVAMVANQLGNFFIEENLRTREVQAVGTSDFLESQLGEAKQRLQEQEATLSVYKLRHSGELPQQEAALLAGLGRLQLQLQGIQDGLSRAQQNKQMTETAYSAAQQSEKALTDIVQQVGAAWAAGSTSAGGASALESEQLQKQLEALQLRYTDQHPEVRAVKDLLAKVREWEGKAGGTSQSQEAGKTDAAAVGTDVKTATALKASPLSQSLLREKERVENLRAQRDLVVQELQALEVERKRVLEQISSSQSRMGRLPVREQELASITRDYEISKANYQSLLDKKLAAQMATEMERRQKSERFSMLDSARVPDKPVKPDRGLFDALGSAAALILAVAIGLGSEFKRGVVLGEWEIPRGIVILGRVHRIPNKLPNGGKVLHRKLRWGFALAALAVLLVAGAVGAGIYLRWIPF